MGKQQQNLVSSLCICRHKEQTHHLHSHHLKRLEMSDVEQLTIKRVRRFAAWRVVADLSTSANFAQVVASSSTDGGCSSSAHTQVAAVTL